MTLIQSSKKDSSTNDVIDWIKYLTNECDLVRINDRFVPNKLTIKISNKKADNSIEVESKHISFDSIVLKSYWYRRGTIEIKRPNLVNNNSKNTDDFHASKLNNAIIEQQIEIEEYIHNLFKSSVSSHINNFHDNFTNKLINLKVASSLGLRVGFPEIHRIRVREYF